MIDADFAVRGAAELLTMDWELAKPPALLREAALAARDGEIVWVGADRDLDGAVALRPNATVLDATGQTVTPGLVDPHSHLVYAGDRAHEFALRCGGAGYLEIARAGGGIRATVAATRAATDEELLALALPRTDALLSQGVTTCEVKSGYGLSVEEELRLLRIVRTLAGRTPMALVPTLLPLHALPPEAEGRRDAWVAEMVDELVPRAAREGLCRMVDAFLEEGAFTAAEVRRLFARAREAGLPLRLHADQLSDGGGAALAAAEGALSADHLERVSPAGIAALARAGTVAVLAPVATWVLRLPSPAPARRLLEAGVPLALCTNLNPGSAPTESVALGLGAACLSYGLQPAEALWAFTRGAAKALGLDQRIGRLAPGLRADVALFGCADHRHLASHLAVSHCVAVAIGGRLVASPRGARCSPPGPRIT